RKLRPGRPESPEKGEDTKEDGSRQERQEAGPPPCHRSTTTTAPLVRNGAKGSEREMAERPYRRMSRPPNSAARLRPRRSASAAIPPSPTTRSSASLTSPIPNEAGQMRLR